jgi:hypothetical protein
VTYQDSRHVWLDNLRLAIASDEGFPHLVARWCRVFLDHDEEGVLKVLLLIASILALVSQQLLVVLATSVGWRSYVQL